MIARLCLGGLTTGAGVDWVVDHLWDRIDTLHCALGDVGATTLQGALAQITVAAAVADAIFNSEMDDWVYAKSKRLHDRLTARAIDFLKREIGVPCEAPYGLIPPVWEVLEQVEALLPEPSTENGGTHAK